jgi:hypothetical protein
MTPLGILRLMAYEALVAWLVARVPLTPASVLAIATLAIAVPLNWFVAIRLALLAHEAPDVRLLRERALAAVFMAVVVTVFSLIFLNNDLVPPLFAFEQTKYLTRSITLAAGIIPALYWLRLYRNGGH